MLLALHAAFAATPVRATGNGDALLRGWEWWKGLSELAREQLAPKLMEMVGKSGDALSLGATSIDNLSRYRAFCGRRSGAFRDTALCQAMQFKLGERSAMSVVLLALHRRAGTQSAPARDAAAILVGLGNALGLDKKRVPATPQHILAGLYEEMGRCAAPACNAGLSETNSLNIWLRATVKFVADHGSDQEVSAANKIMNLGWRK